MKLSDKGEELLQKYKDIYNGEQYYQQEDIVADKKKVIFDGYSMFRHLWPSITEITNKMKSFTFLDYGCGRAKHLYARVLPDNKSFHEHFKGKVQCYYLWDPANPPYMRKPPKEMKFDIIVCADVMEHIAEEDVSSVIEDIASYTHEKSFVLFSICGAPAMKSFIENQENFHVTLKDREWWKEQISNHFDIKRTILKYHK